MAKAIRPQGDCLDGYRAPGQSQVYNLFLRTVKSSPPRDSMSRTTSSPSAAGRRRRFRSPLRGHLRTGRTPQSALIRVYTALLAAAQHLYDVEGYGRMLTHG